jgi:hypothetical protein
MKEIKRESLLKTKVLLNIHEQRVALTAILTMFQCAVFLILYLDKPFLVTFRRINIWISFNFSVLVLKHTSFVEKWYPPRILSSVIYVIFVL